MEKTPEYIEFLKTKVSHNVKPEIAKLMIEYALTPEEHKKAYQKVDNYVFSGKSPVKNPKIFLVISQTGGGKSTLTSKILRENPNTILLDTDAFKAFNPYKEEICEKFPTLYGYLTGIDAYLHRDEAYQKAIQEGYNILLEIAPSTKEKFFNVNFEELEHYGYQIDANILAVSRINSLLSIHERFEGQIESNMSSPKLTDFKRANDSYEAVPIVLEELIRMPQVMLSVWQRGSFEFDKDATFVPSPIFLTSEKSKAMMCLVSARKNDEAQTLKNCDTRITNVKRQMKLRSAPSEQRAQFSEIEHIIAELQQQYI